MKQELRMFRPAGERRKRHTAHEMNVRTAHEMEDKMSGPKISVYSLTGRAREIVLEQFRCEQNSLVCASQIRKMLSELSDMNSELDGALEILQLSQSRLGGQDDLIREAESLRSGSDEELGGIKADFEAHIPKMSAKYVITEEALTEKKQELETLKDIRKRLKDFQKEVRKAAESGREVRETGQQEIRKSISKDLGGILSFEEIETAGAMGSTSQEEAARTLKARAAEQLQNMLKEDLPEDLKTEARHALEALERLSRLPNLQNFESVTLRRLTGKAQELRRARAREQAEYEALLERYEPLREMLLSGEATSRDGMEKAEGICSVPGMSEGAFTPETPPADRSRKLEEIIAKMEAELVHRQEQSYIATCVDEVMAEMGYDLIGSRDVKKRSGKRFKNELYRFGEGTAVNVTYSPEGQIAMEVGGLAHEDRIPDEEETDLLTGEMEHFCGEFAVFEQKMKERGVIVGNRVSLLPPSPAYASIINVDDYARQDNGPVTELRAQSRRKRRRKTAQGKAEHM